MSLFQGVRGVLLIFFSFFLFELLTLTHYGTDWDTINHFPRGQAYLRYFLTHELNYKNLPEYVEYHQDENSLGFSPDKAKNSLPKRSIYQINDYNGAYFLKKDGGHPPLSDILAATFNAVLFQQLRLVNDIDSYHAYIIFVASFFVSVLFWWARKNYGLFPAIVTTISLVLYPLFLSESHFNVKDIPQASFYGLMIISLYEGITSKKLSRIILAAVFFGMAWGTKFNVLFSVFSIVPWLIIYFISHRNTLKQYSWLLPTIIIFPAISVLIFWGSWPYLWKNTITHFLEIVNYYKTIGINPDFDKSFIFLGLNTYAIQWIIYTTPLVTLFFAFFGILYTFIKGFKEKEKTALLVLLWFVVPIVRVSVPNAGIYGGVRQIMEYIPAMAILAGIGASYIVKQFREWSHKIIKQSNSKRLALILQASLILAFLPITLKLISIHPNENVYFNPLIGGLKGAKEREFPYWGNSFGNAYRQGASWINAHAENKSTLVLAQELMPNLPRLFVRSDLKYGNNLRSGYLRNGEYIIGLDYGLKTNRSYYSSRYYNAYLDPIYTIKIDDTSILNIWKNDNRHTKKEYLREEKIKTSDITITERGIFIDLQKPMFLSRIEWEFYENNCTPSQNIYFEVSSDKENWYRTPHSLPEDLPIPILARQPTNNSLSYPFAAEYAQYIFVNIDPNKEACLNKIKGNINVYYLPNVIKQ